MAEIKEAPKPKTANGPGQTTEIAPRPTAPGAPLGVMRRIARDVDRLFEEFGLESGFHLPRFLSRGRELFRREVGFVPADWSPQIDIVEQDSHLVVRADLPGLSKDDIKVDVTDDLLTIQGERKQEKREERKGCCYSECSYGSFYRAIPLPEGAEASKATADFHNGVLTITVPTPARPAPKSRQVVVREGK